MDIKTKIFMAPMSGVSDLSFRLICREFKAKLCFFEMIDANALRYEHPRTLEILKTNKKDKPIAAQLLGRDPSIIKEAAHKLLDYVDISFLDINSACPAPKVIKKGAGAHLLKDTETLYKILKTLSSSLPIPVTVKTRIGYGTKSVQEAVKLAKGCQEAGASMFFVHGRTKLDGYRGEIDYESIRAIKKALKIPVIGSGNILNPTMAKKMFDETGCDGILVARGALGNPWIFQDIENYLKKEKPPEKPSLAMRKKILKRHVSYIRKYKDMSPANMVGFTAKVAMWYLKGLSQASRIRHKLCNAKTQKELLSVINNIKVTQRSKPFPKLYSLKS